MAKKCHTSGLVQDKEGFMEDVTMFEGQEEGELRIERFDSMAWLTRDGFVMVGMLMAPGEVACKTGEKREGKYCDEDVVRYELRDIPYVILRRSKDSVLAEMAKEVAAIRAAKYEAEAELKKARAEMAAAATAKQNAEEDLARLHSRAESAARMETDLAKVREAIGSERFREIVGRP